jgi:hypothetical protein
MPIEPTPERQEQWRLLAGAAIHALQFAFDLEPRVKASAVLRLWEEPALGDPLRSWTVGLSGRPQVATVRRVTWLRSADRTQVFDSLESLRRGKPLAPRLELVDAPVSVRRLRSVFAQARKLRFAALGATGPMGLDGHTSGVWFRAGFNEVRFEWWSGGPPAWAPLLAWHRNAENWLNECARRAATHGPVTLYPQEAFVRTVRARRVNAG